MGVKSVFGGGGGAPTDAQYVALATDASLTAERVLTAGAGISLTDAGAGGAVTVAATGGAAGKILQVVHVPFTGVMAGTSTSWAAVTDSVTTLAATITPSAVSSKILIQVSANVECNSGYAVIFQLWDGSAAVGGGLKKAGSVTQEDGVLFQVFNTTNRYTTLGFASMALDEPATTSAVTYTFRGRSTHASAVFYVNRNTRDLDNLEDSRVPSSITLFEIGA